MDILHRFLLLIYVLYYTAIIHGASLDVNDAETCSMLCRQCNASAIFTNDQCECKFIEDKDEGIKCIQHVQKENRTIDLNVLSDDLTDEERNIRAILKSRRRLRTGDAEKVAQYFINGGPSAGHSHFVKAFNAACDSVDSAINSFSGDTDKSNTENEFHDVQSYLPLSTSPVVGNTYGSPLCMVLETAPETSPAMPDIRHYTPILGMTDPVFGYPSAELQDPILGSIIHRNRYISPIHALLRMAAIPSEIVNNALAYRHAQRFPVNHGNLLGSGAYVPQNNLPTSSFNNIGQPCTDNDASMDNGVIASNGSPSVRNNADMLVGSNIANIPSARSIGPSYYPALTPYNFNTYQPMQYEYLVSPYLYTPYQNPLYNALYPPFDKHLVQAVPSYSQSTSDVKLGSTQNTNPYCIDNVNIKQKSDAPTDINKIVNSNGEKEEKDDKTNKISLSKDKENEKNEKDENGKY